MEIVKIRAKKAFTPTKLPGAKWVINPYIGCQHACKYCYAKFMCKWYNYGKWGSWVVVKENLPELVKREFVKGWVYMGSVSDVYQPIEKKIKLTQRVLKNMDKRIKLSILTKSDLVLRDVNLFKKFKRIEIGLTVNSWSGELKKEIEPFSPSMKKRIEALKRLREEEIVNYAFISPVIPSLTDLGKVIQETKSFVDFYWIEILNLKGSGSSFQRWIRDNYPSSFKILSEKEKLIKFVKDEMKKVKKEKIKIKGIYLHHPKLQVKGLINF